LKLRGGDEMKDRRMFYWVFLTIVLFVAFWFLMKSQYATKSELELDTEKAAVRISWDAAEDTVADNRRALCEAFNNGDFGDIGPLYMENAVIRSAEGKLFSGREQIVRYWRELNEGGVLSIEYELLALFPLGQIDYTVGNVHYNRAAQEYGRYTFHRGSESGSSVAEMTGKNGIDYHQEDCPWKFGSEEHP